LFSRPNCTNACERRVEQSQKWGERCSPILGDKSTRQLMNKILRVDHAGEFGAQRIYAGQLALLYDSEYHKEIKEMRNQELKHYTKMKQLIRERRVRPSLLSPFWNVSGFFLGIHIHSSTYSHNYTRPFNFFVFKDV
jgi:demethoxyubiquinone hydroxylase (CLK1/Coq7/Cat5 family)